MAQLLYPLALLACPVGMGLMMWMMRSNKTTETATQDLSRTSANELTLLRAEVDQLRAAQRDSSTHRTGAGTEDRG